MVTSSIYIVVAVHRVTKTIDKSHFRNMLVYIDLQLYICHEEVA